MMGKFIKKISCMIAVVAMIFSLTTAVKAATVSIDEELDGHTFVAYQILSGTQSESSENVLGNPKWGNGINLENFIAALKDYNSEIFGQVENAIDFYNALSTHSNVANDVAKIAYAYTTGSGTAINKDTTHLDSGYYLIVDTTDLTGEYDASNLALLQVTDEIVIQSKSNVPSVEKKVQEDDKYSQDGGYGQGYNDVADWNIGDQVPFKLIGTLPDDYENYKSYKYVFHDIISTGLTFNNDVKVYVSTDKTGSNKEEISNSDYSVNPTSNGFTVTFNDLKQVATPTITENSFIIVEYTATLNEDAVIGLPGNPNEVYLEFSNNPNYTGNGESSPTGETPHDKVIVFTYELDVTKVDGTNNETLLKDAEFKLQDSKNNKWVIVDPGTGKVTGWAENEEEGSSLKSDENGLFKVIGLDDGTYYLKETKAPDGYNLLANPIEVTITATTQNDQNWTGDPSHALTALTVSVDDENAQVDEDVTGSGVVGVIVKNNTGSELPETGGIGNYVFYGVGGILMLAAAYYFIRKKNEKKI